MRINFQMILNIKSYNYILIKKIPVSFMRKKINMIFFMIFNIFKNRFFLKA